MNYELIHASYVTVMYQLYDAPRDRMRAGCRRSLNTWTTGVFSCGAADFRTVCRGRLDLLGGLMNFFGILGATLSPYLTGVIAQATGAFVAPLVLAVCIMLVASATLIQFFPYRSLSELVGKAPSQQAKLAA
jgi:hypothetical protein